jgi:hypothetical protein
MDNETENGICPIISGEYHHTTSHLKTERKPSNDDFGG